MAAPWRWSLQNDPKKKIIHYRILVREKCGLNCEAWKWCNSSPPWQPHVVVLTSPIVRNSKTSLCRCRLDVHHSVPRGTLYIKIMRMRCLAVPDPCRLDFIYFSNFSVTTNWAKIALMAKCGITCSAQVFLIWAKKVPPYIQYLHFAPVVRLLFFWSCNSEVMTQPLADEW